MAKINYCGSCKHYIGGGDWNLCCDRKYDLCYRDTVACNQYEYSQDVVDREEAQRVRLAKWVQERLERANKGMEQNV